MHLFSAFARRVSAATIICIGSFGLTSMTEAATFNATAQVGLCSDGPSASSLPTSATCSFTVNGPNNSVTGTATAASGLGSLSASAEAWTFRDVDRAQRGTGAANGLATYSDVISITGITTGTLVLPVDVMGSNIGLGSSITGSVRIGGETVYSLSKEGTASNIGGISQALHSISNPSFISITAFLNAQAQACTQLFSIPSSCTASSNFGSSMRFLGITVLDEAGQDVTNSIFVTSQSGFDYIAGATPHDRMSPIPLPASAYLLLGGLFGLGIAKHGRRRRAS